MDPFEVVCAGTEVLNSISFKKDSSGRRVAGVGGMDEDAHGLH